jgi:hypothetical protein
VYRISTIQGDAYGGGWPRENFEQHGIVYSPVKPGKSDLYRDMLPKLNGGLVELPDHPKLVAQICSLERKTGRGGRGRIDHPIGAHDDISNALAVLVSGFTGWTREIKIWGGYVRQTVEEAIQEYRERVAASREEIDTAIAREGMWWPHWRRGQSRPWHPDEPIFEEGKW